MANRQEQTGDDGHLEGQEKPWSGHSTPPDVYGRTDSSNFPAPVDPMEVTAEDLQPAAKPHPTHAVREKLHNQLSELEESGDYDLHTIAPLRHLLDQDWTDPNVRSRLTSRADEESASGPGGAKGKGWFHAGQENPATSETLEVSAVGEPAAASDASAGSGPALAHVAPSAPQLPSTPSGLTAVARTKPRVRPWLLVVGAALVAGAFALPESLFASAPVTDPVPRLVLSTEPAAGVYQGEQHLGETPLLLEPEQTVGGLLVKRAGYQPQTLELEERFNPDRIVKHHLALEVAPLPLDWAGLPAESKLTWQGEAKSPEALDAALPGSYKVSVSLPERPPVTLTVAIPHVDEQYDGAPLKVGEQVQQALAKQPTFSMTLKSGQEKTPKLPLAVSVTQSQGGSFKKTAQLDGKASSKLILPGAGTYQVKVPASATHRAYSKTVTVKEGGSQSLEIALTPVPPKVTVAAAPASVSSSHGYAPAPVYYAPPPVYHGGGGGGGGGGGSIAPPSF